MLYREIGRNEYKIRRVICLEKADDSIFEQGLFSGAEASLLLAVNRSRE